MDGTFAASVEDLEEEEDGGGLVVLSKKAATVKGLLLVLLDIIFFSFLCIYVVCGVFCLSVDCQNPFLFSMHIKLFILRAQKA